MSELSVAQSFGRDMTVVSRACASRPSAPQVFFFFRGQGGVQQAKQQAAVAAFKMSVASGNAGAGANRV